MEREYMRPEDIEKKSMLIVEDEMGPFECSYEMRQVIKRVAHATADVEFGKSIIFHPESLESGLFALREGRDIITDVAMVEVGIRKDGLKKFGNRVYCFLNDEMVIEMAKKDGIPRSALAMRLNRSLIDGSIIVIGNAPTALFEVVDLIVHCGVRPALVIGVPIGFVGAAESKELLRTVSVPYITNEGRRGGSAVAVSIMNALIKLAVK